MIAADSGLFLVLPDNLCSRYEIVTFITEKPLTTFGTELELFAACRAMWIHVKFVVWAITFAFFTEKPCPIRGKFLYQFGTAFTANSSYHDSLPWSVRTPLPISMKLPSAMFIP
jgi:hypothetical protein